MAETTILVRMIQIEKQAKELVSQAEVEAQNAMTLAKRKEAEEFTKMHSALIAEKEIDYKAKSDQINKKHTKLLEEYANDLENKKLNFSAFRGKALELLKQDL